MHKGQQQEGGGGSGINHPGAGSPGGCARALGMTLVTRECWAWWQFLEQDRVVPMGAGRVVVSNGMYWSELVWQEGAPGSAALFVHQTRE